MPDRLLKKGWSALRKDGALAPPPCAPQHFSRIHLEGARAAELKPRPSGTPFGRAAAVLSLAVSLALCTRRPSPPRPYLAFVANEASNTVAVVNLASLQVIRSIAVAPQPVEVAARPGSRELYALSGSGVLSVILYRELRVTNTIRIGASASNLVFAPDGGLAVALDRHTQELVFVNCSSRRIEGRLRPGDISDLVFTPDGKTLVAGDRSGDRLIFVGTSSRRVLGEVPVGKTPGAMVVLPDGSKLFVADTGERKVSAVDLANRQLLSHIEISAKPSDLVLKPDGGEVFVLSREAATLTILDAFHDDVEQEISIGRNPVAAVPSRDSTRLYIANSGDGSVEALDIQNRQVLASTHAGTAPQALALTPDERFLVVTDLGGSSLSVLATAPLGRRSSKTPSLSPLPLITTIPVGARPVGVAVPDWAADSRQ
jgi:YVTN family beta-propeller protein